MIIYYIGKWIMTRNPAAKGHTHASCGVSPVTRAIADSPYYEQVADEIEAGTNLSKGLWTRALTDALGNQTVARSLYIKYRAEQLKTEEQEIMADVTARQRARIAAHNRIQTQGILFACVGLGGAAAMYFKLPELHPVIPFLLASGSIAAGIGYTRGEPNLAFLVGCILGPIGILLVLGSKPKRK